MEENIKQTLQVNEIWHGIFHPECLGLQVFWTRCFSIHWSNKPISNTMYLKITKTQINVLPLK